jgi:hypothetical protein
MSKWWKHHEQFWDKCCYSFWTFSLFFPPDLGRLIIFQKYKCWNWKKPPLKGCANPTKILHRDDIDVSKNKKTRKNRMSFSWKKKYTLHTTKKNKKSKMSSWFPSLNSVFCFWKNLKKKIQQQKNKIKEQNVPVTSSTPLYKRFNRYLLLQNRAKQSCQLIWHHYSFIPTDKTQKSSPKKPTKTTLRSTTPTPPPLL